MTYHAYIYKCKLYRANVIWTMQGAQREQDHPSQFFFSKINKYMQVARAH
jgi:hypothetical protein